MGFGGVGCVLIGAGRLMKKIHGFHASGNIFDWAPFFHAAGNETPRRTTGNQRPA
jgi:hypothetical protein